ncbi:hypothetical protein F4677DRAFT_262453 [Hypoxylon crocopeplum]|nr:hypothetical protein F4677DRAFT_262453 [Hypoxylon crocopeplum]
MVAWSTRCGACRQRKIKCDQQWPTCGQCRKKKLYCPGPPERHRFVRENPSKLSPHAARVTFSGSLLRIHMSNTQPQIPCSVPNSHAAQVGAELVSFITSQPKTFGISSFAQLMGYVPAMLNDSSALTGAVACLSNARKRQLTLPRPDGKLDPKLYGSALRELRYALQDSNKLDRIETLLATLIMWRVEATIATTAELPHLIVTWSVHLAGVGYLLERLGPEAAKDKLVFYVVLESASELASHFYARDESFFFASPQWQGIFDHHLDFPVTYRLLFQVFGQMAVFPDVMRDLRRYHIGQVKFQHVRSRVKAMLDAFKSISKPLEAILEDRSLVRQRAACSSGSPVEEIYEAEQDILPRVCCLHAMASIVSHNMLSALDGDASHEHEKDNHLLSRRIWMFHEQATRVGSFGMYYYPTALLLSYGSARSRETENWIVDLLNRLGERNPVTDIMWTREEISQRYHATSGNSQLPPK